MKRLLGHKRVRGLTDETAATSKLNRTSQTNSVEHANLFAKSKPQIQQEMNHDTFLDKLKAPLIPQGIAAVESENHPLCHSSNALQDREQSQSLDLNTNYC